MSKIQIQKQITTQSRFPVVTLVVCLICQRYKFKSKSQLFGMRVVTSIKCVWYVKDTNSKANHNELPIALRVEISVFDMSKIQIQKQITTFIRLLFQRFIVCLICQRYKFKSKSQQYACCWWLVNSVFDMSKIQIQKQITTVVARVFGYYECVWYVKDTNSKANHNEYRLIRMAELSVFDMSKIQIQKQITTWLLRVDASH